MLFQSLLQYINRIQNFHNKPPESKMLFQSMLHYIKKLAIRSIFI